LFMILSLSVAGRRQGALSPSTSMVIESIFSPYSGIP
jgi:hypothetical protein